MTVLKVAPTQERDVDLSKTYDAVVVGSGAAGGMAAHVLTSQGMQVLMLEAGKKIDINQELRSMEWPYEHPGPAGAAALRLRLQGQDPRRLLRRLAHFVRRYRTLLRQGRHLPRHLRL